MRARLDATTQETRRSSGLLQWAEPSIARTASSRSRRRTSRRDAVLCRGRQKLPTTLVVHGDVAQLRASRELSEFLV